MSLVYKLKEAAAFLGLHPQTLQERARAGKVPLASKPGKAWIFPIEGLEAYRNSFSPCPSIESAKSGTSIFHQSREEFVARLGLPIRKPRRSSTTTLKGGYGDRKS